MDDTPDLVFPSDLETKMRSIFVSDLDVRVKDLTALVALQETELTFLWVILLGSLVYIVGKDYRGRRRQATTGNTIQIERKSIEDR